MLATSGLIIWPIQLLPWAFGAVMTRGRHQLRDLFVTRPDSSELAVGRQESIYADIFPFVRASRGFWLSSLGLFALLYALQFVSVPITIFFYGFSALDLANISAFDLAGIFLNSLFAFLLYVLAVLASRMSWGFGIALLAIGVPYTLFLAGAAVLLSMSFWDQPVFIGGFLIVWMCGIFVSIWMLKAGYRYVVSDNFIRMLVADSQEKRLFSLSSLSTSLGIPFSIEHIRHQRSKILMYFIISNRFYMRVSPQS